MLARSDVYSSLESQSRKSRWFRQGSLWRSNKQRGSEVSWAILFQFILMRSQFPLPAPSCINLSILSRASIT